MLELPNPLLVQLAQHSSDLVAVFNPDFKLIFLNNAGRALLGSPHTGSPILSLHNLIAPTFIAKLSDEILPQAVSGRVWDGVLQLCRQSDAAVIQTYCFVSAIKSNDDNLRGYAIIAHAVNAETAALERLERKAASFNALIENCPFGVFVVDSELRVLVVSNGASSVFEGFDISSHPKHEDVVRTLWPQQFADEIMSRFHTTLETGESYLAPSTIEERFDTQAMEAYDWRIDRIVLPEGSFGVVCYFYDLTERQRWADDLMAAKLREEANARELEGLYREAPIGLAMVDRELRFTRMNPAFEVMGGKSNIEAIGKTPWDLAPQLREKVQPMLQSILETREAVRQFPIIGKKHETLDVPREWVNQIYPVLGRDGDVAGIGFMVQDVTLQRHSEAILRESEEKLRLVLDQLFPLVAILTPEGHIIDASKSGVEAAGLTLAEIKGKHLADMIWWTYSPQTQATMRDGIAQAMAGGIFRQDMVAKVGDDLITIDLQFAPLKNTHGENIGVIASGVAVEDRVQAQRELQILANNLEQQVARRTEALVATNAKLMSEIAQRETVQAALLQSQKLEAMGQLVAGVAHDFNNILASVISGLSLIERKTNDEFVSEVIATSTKAARRGAGVVKQMLAFARQQPLSAQHIEVRTVFEELRPLILMALDNDARLVIVETPDLWPILVDGDQLHSAILNLAINARDAMPKGGFLTISAVNVDEGAADRPVDLATGDFVAISIADTGSGMSAETLAKFAEPFFTTKAVGKGTGLGVAMVHGFVNQSGGTLAVTSEVGVGTNVTLYLPRAVEKRQPQAAETNSAVAKPHTTILVVDDDADLRFMTAATLNEAGFDVTAAESGRRALELMDDFDFNLVITDFMMPEMDGAELAQAIRAKRPYQPIMFVTGHANRDALKNEDVLFKPFEIDALIRHVNQNLARIFVAA